MSGTTPAAASIGRSIAPVLAVMTLTLSLDQASKAWAWNTLRGAPGRVAGDGLVSFAFAFNPGAAFGLAASHPTAPLGFFVAASVGLGILIRLGLRAETPAMRVAAGLGAGGIAGNLIDRLIRNHPRRIDWLREATFADFLEHPTAIADAIASQHRYLDIPRHGVIDFVVVSYGPGRTWPAFNLADAAIVVALAWLVVQTISPPRHRVGRR
ncbi:MAG: signal peptidase II [Myxococcales bacterium FL481]|nr:MAG: signal peptidase II [Myxococcales bacterium FL481]